jgi:hypothetical protein
LVAVLHDTCGRMQYRAVYVYAHLVCAEIEDYAQAVASTGRWRSTLRLRWMLKFQHRRDATMPIDDLVVEVRHLR